MQSFTQPYYTINGILFCITYINYLYKVYLFTQDEYLLGIEYRYYSCKSTFAIIVGKNIHEA